MTVKQLDEVGSYVSDIQEVGRGRFEKPINSSRMHEDTSEIHPNPPLPNPPLPNPPLQGPSLRVNAKTQQAHEIEVPAHHRISAQTVEH